MNILKKHADMPTKIDALSKDVVDCIFQVHKNLGPGFLERIYEDCLCMELAERGIAFTRQFPINLSYKGKTVETDFRLDIVVDDVILLELKAIERIHPVHEAQIYSYLKMSGLPLGLLVNFNVPMIKEGIKRFVPKENLRNFVTSRQAVGGER